MTTHPDRLTRLTDEELEEIRRCQGVARQLKTPDDEAGFLLLDLADDVDRLLREIDTLRPLEQENRRLRETLEKVLRHFEYYGCRHGAGDVEGRYMSRVTERGLDIARQALGEEKT